MTSAPLTLTRDELVQLHNLVQSAQAQALALAYTEPTGPR